MSCPLGRRRISMDVLGLYVPMASLEVLENTCPTISMYVKGTFTISMTLLWRLCASLGLSAFSNLLVLLDSVGLMGLGWAQQWASGDAFGSNWSQQTSRYNRLYKIAPNSVDQYDTLIHINSNQFLRFAEHGNYWYCQACPRYTMHCLIKP